MNRNRALRFLAGGFLTLTLSADARGALPFVEDDYAGAMARARSRKVPVFVEAWAPW